VSDVGSDRFQNTQGFFNKEFKRNTLEPYIFVIDSLSQDVGFASHGKLLDEIMCWIHSERNFPKKFI
jgi:hypothetical protein